MDRSHIHAPNQRLVIVQSSRRADDDEALLASLRIGITQSQIAIYQSLAAIASTRDAIASLDRLQARQNSN
jgi:hypothetical protein